MAERENAQGTRFERDYSGFYGGLEIPEDVGKLFNNPDQVDDYVDAIQRYDREFANLVTSGGIVQDEQGGYRFEGPNSTEYHDRLNGIRVEIADKILGKDSSNSEKGKEKRLQLGALLQPEQAHARLEQILSQGEQSQIV